MENVNYNKKKASNPTFKLSTVLVSSQKSSFVHVGGTTEWLFEREMETEMDECFPLIGRSLSFNLYFLINRYVQKTRV